MVASPVTASDRPDEDGRRPDADGVIQAEFDWSAKAPSNAVVEAVAIASDREPTAVEPLYESVDPDALDALVGSNGTDSEDGEASVSFEHAGHVVTVHSDGSVVVRPGS